MKNFKFISLLFLLIGSLAAEVTASEEALQQEINENALNNSYLKGADSSSVMENSLNREITRIHPNKYDQWSYAAAHAFGALAVEGVTMSCGMIGAAIVGSSSRSYDGMAVGGLIGSACGFTIGLASTKALGGSRKAIACGCVAGLTAFYLTEKPLLSVISTMAVSGTMASWDF